MDLSLSANPQTLSLISCAPFSSTSSSLLSPPRFRPLRREFLGCGHNLRPPGLRSRRKCKKLGFHIQSPRFLFRASLDSQAIIVVVAVVTVSALTVVYLNYSKRKQNVKKMSGLSILASPERIRGIMNWVIMHDIFGTKDIARETSVGGNKDSMQQMGEFGHASEDKAVQLVMKEPALMHEETLITKTLECHGSEIIAPPVSDPISSRESEVAGLSFSPYVLSESGAHQPVNCATEMPELEFEGCGQETEFGSDLHKLMVKEKLTVASVPMDSALAEVNEHKKANTEPGEESDTISYSSVFRESVREELYTFYEANQPTEYGSDMHKLTGKEKLTVDSVPMDNAHAEVNEHKKVNTELGEDSDTISHSSVFRESVREDIYTFYEANQPAMKSVENLNHLNSLSSHASNRGSNIFSSPIRSSTTKGAELLVPKFLHTADRMLVPSENFEGKISLGLFKEGSPNKRKDSRKSGGFPRDKEKRILPQNGYRNLPRTPLPDGMHDDGGHHPSLKLSVYIRFLRDGRLIDCIELLEDMQRKGLLDMDKVYHAGFFRVCKSQKAVKEAFRFTKLIPNPALSTFNMLMSVCASSQDSEGAFQVLQLVQEAGLKADCKLYTTLISTCAKSGKVDAMFKVFHEMVNAKVEPNVHTYGALIDGCAKAGQVAKAFGAYGIMRSKNVKPDRVVFNALITACGQAGAVDRAFDVLAEMRAETEPIDPDHVTVGALIKACANAGQVDRAREVYNMIHEYNIKGTPEVYTIAVNSCSQIGDWVFACNVYSDMTRNGIVPDEMFLSALIDVAGHAGKVDAAFDILQAARNQGAHIGLILYSSLMGACSNAKNWQKALELYEDIKSIKLKPTVSTMNALITALCDGEQLQQAVDVLFEMKRVGLCPNTVTYSILLVASEKKDDLEVGLMLLSQAKKDGVAPNLVMCRCLIAMCLRRFERACTLGEPVLSFNSGRPQLDSKWTSLALMVYRETIAAGVVPTMEEFSQALGCLQVPHFSSLRERFIENLGVCTRTSRSSNLCSLVDGFGEYDPRAFSLLEEAASLGIVPCVSFKESPIVVDARKLPIHTAEVYLLTVLKGLKHRLAAGAKLPNITILLPIEKTQILSPNREKTINVAGRISQAIAALLRRLGLPYLGNESFGKIRINGVVVKRWFQPKLASPFSGKPTELSSPLSRLSKGIIHQQRNIRTGNLSLE